LRCPSQTDGKATVPIISRAHGKGLTRVCLAKRTSQNGNSPEDRRDHRCSRPKVNLRESGRQLPFLTHCIKQAPKHNDLDHNAVGDGQRVVPPPRVLRARENASARPHYHIYQMPFGRKQGLQYPVSPTAKLN
jgi:hypothetical protein